MTKKKKKKRDPEINNLFCVDIFKYAIHHTFNTKKV